MQTLEENNDHNAAVGGKCPKCDGILVERHGKNGSFIGCSNYPKCRFTNQSK
ncbi:MAG: topoisomerase DNA-binding C4 zinc finger domain-containing protein [Oscillospiraceae bacterium]|nr:topoisomerase DNA-binding C4 zinc finger domain-containing protein [Oscillospiraceae bacterium]